MAKPQEVQSLVRNELTQDNPDIQMSGLSAFRSAHTHVKEVQKYTLCSKGILLIVLVQKATTLTDGSLL